MLYEPITRGVALQLCAEIRQVNRRKRYSFARFQFWGCVTFTRGNPDKMCLNSKGGYRGCYMVNNRYAKRKKGA